MNKPVNRTVLYVLLVSILLELVLGINSVLYTNYEANKAIAKSNANIQQSERMWCVLLTSIDNGNQKNPPTTASGKAFALAIHNLRNSFHC